MGGREAKTSRPDEPSLQWETLLESHGVLQELYRPAVPPHSCGDTGDMARDLNTPIKVWWHLEQPRSLCTLTECHGLL